MGWKDAVDATPLHPQFQTSDVQGLSYDGKEAHSSGEDGKGGSRSATPNKFC